MILKWLEILTSEVMMSMWCHDADAVMPHRFGYERLEFNKRI